MTEQETANQTAIVTIAENLANGALDGSIKGVAVVLILGDGVRVEIAGCNTLSGIALLEIGHKLMVKTVIGKE